MDHHPVPVGVIGVGGFGAYRCQRLRATGAFAITVAYDRDPVALAACCREHGCRAAADIDDLLHAPGLAGVAICTDPASHAEIALAALARGLHVLVEKPLCTSPAEATALFAAARRYGRSVVVGHVEHSRHAPSRIARDLLASGDLGEIVSVEATTAHSGSWHIRPGDWRADPRRNPGGMLFHCGVHRFHELDWLLGPIAEVACLQRVDLNRATATADAAICLLRFASGVVGTLTAYHVTPYRHGLTILGTSATLTRDDRHFSEGTSLMLQRTQRDGAYEPRIAIDLGAQEEAGDGALHAWRAAIAGDDDGHASLTAAMRAVGAVFAAERSWQAGGVAMPVTDVTDHEHGVDHPARV